VRFIRDAIITIAILALVIFPIAYLTVRTGGFSADAQPGRIEEFVARNLVRLSIPSSAAREENPFRGEPQAWRTAAEHYESHCAACHGADGRADTAIAKGLYPKAPDLTQPIVQGLTDSELFYVIQNGVRWTGMPAWRLQHSNEESWRLVSFVRKLPTLTPQDLEDLHQMSESGNDEHDHHDHGHHEHHD
jgi:mono/diheme cytochrome c family protein